MVASSVSSDFSQLSRSSRAPDALAVFATPVSDAALQAAVRRLRPVPLRAVVEAARFVAQDSAVPGASVLARRLLTAVATVHGAAALLP